MTSAELAELHDFRTAARDDAAELEAFRAAFGCEMCGLPLRDGADGHGLGDCAEIEWTPLREILRLRESGAALYAMVKTQGAAIEEASARMNELRDIAAGAKAERAEALRELAAIRSAAPKLGPACAAVAPPAPPRVWFFGAWSPDNIGHYFYAPSGLKAPHPIENRILAALVPVDASHIDAMLPPPRDRNETATAMAEPTDIGRVHCRGGFTALAWWDRGGDKRSNSNSAIIVETTAPLGFDELLRLGVAAFPHLADRLPLREYVAT